MNIDAQIRIYCSISCIQSSYKKILVNNKLFEFMLTRAFIRSNSLVFLLLARLKNHIFSLVNMKCLNVSHCFDVFFFRFFR